MPTRVTELAQDTFRRRLREEMERRGISQSELARRAKTSQSNVWRILNGERQVTIPFAERLAKGIERPLRELL